MRSSLSRNRQYTALEIESGEQRQSRAWRQPNAITQQNYFGSYLHQNKHGQSEYKRTALADLERAILEGDDFKRLMSTKPDEVFRALKKGAVRKVAHFTANDDDVLSAFGDGLIMTRGINTLEDSNPVEFWTKEIERLAMKKIYRDSGGWNQRVTLTVYDIIMKNAGGVGDDSILRPLLKKENRGTATDEVWNYPVVETVIEYKWHHWAHYYLRFELILHMGWLLCFVGYLITYISTDLNEDYDKKSGEMGERVLVYVAYILDFCSVLFMTPFLVIEYNSIVYYKWRWLQLWNIIDACTYALQFTITIEHCSRNLFYTDKYSSILAIHCILLFLKVQYYSRVLGSNAAYVETLKTIIYSVRYLLLFICMTMVSVALAFAVLYNDEVDEKKLTKAEAEANGEDPDEAFNENLEDFESIPRAMVTTYSILLGNFESSYVFDTRNRFVKGCFFLCFQLFMSITLLNLLIAVMTESYSTSMERRNMVYNRSRAQVIDELEISLPPGLIKKPEPYIQFIAVENATEYESKESENAQSSNNEDVKAEIGELKRMITELRQEVAFLRNPQPNV